MLPCSMRAKFFGLSLVLGSLALAPVLAAPRYTPSPDGQEITDSKTGLVWQRCAEGMVWKGGTCAGNALFSNHSAAVVRAKAAGQPWRLPTMKELSGIVSMRDAGDGKAAIDPVAFPATPVARYWSSSNAGPNYFIFVGFMEGSAGEGERNSPGALRLVRSAK